MANRRAIESFGTVNSVFILMISETEDEIWVIASRQR